MPTTDIPTRDEIVARVTAIVPTLRANAGKAEDDRRIPDESIEALADADVFKLRVPRRFGGYEADTRTLVEVGAEIGRADGSTGWTASVYWIPTWMVGQFPETVQEEVFATPDVRVSGTLSPSAMAAPVEGGIVVNGKWGFISGAHHAHWQEIIAILVGGEGEPYPVAALVPTSDLLVVDDWHTSGLRGSGSVSTIAQDLFVPAERVLPLPVLLQGGGTAAATAIHRPPLLPVAAASSIGTALGLARAARETFLDRLPDRKITYTSYEQQSAAPITHLQIADATLRADRAEFHAHRLSGLVDAKAADGSAWTPLERAQARADLGSVVRLAKETVDGLANASGGSSIFSDVPIQRIQRDINAINQHALMHPDTNDELYGRVLCGLEPNTLYF